MEKIHTLQHQQNVFFFISNLPTSSHIVTPVFPGLFTLHPSFYGNSLQDDQVQDVQKKNSSQIDQANGVSIGQDDCGNVRKIIENQNESKQIQEYHPNNRAIKGKNKKVYEKDKDRNILPNTMSKLFFFMKSTNKSIHLLNKILENDRNLASFIIPSRYYAYQNYLKTKLRRYLALESLQQMFRVNESTFEIFSLQQQLACIKINSILLRNFFQSPIYYQILISSPRIPKNKIQSYLTNSRKIVEKAEQYLLQAKKLYNFSLIEVNSSN